MGAAQEPCHLSGVGVSGEVAGVGEEQRKTKEELGSLYYQPHSLVRRAQTPSEADSGSCNWLEKAVIWGVICSKKLNKVE